MPDHFLSTHQIQKQHQWPGLKAIGKVVRVRETADKSTTEAAYYLLSGSCHPSDSSIRAFLLFL